MKQRIHCNNQEIHYSSPASMPGFSHKMHYWIIITLLDTKTPRWMFSFKMNLLFPTFLYQEILGFFSTQLKPHKGPLRAKSTSQSLSSSILCFKRIVLYIFFVLGLLHYSKRITHDKFYICSFMDYTIFMSSLLPFFGKRKR